MDLMETFQTSNITKSFESGSLTLQQNLASISETTFLCMKSRGHNWVKYVKVFQTPQTTVVCAIVNWRFTTPL